jgi:hypothetical protein
LRQYRTGSRAEIASAIAEVFTSFINSPKVLIGDEQFGFIRRRSQPNMLIRISRYPQTARPPCKPRDVVIVQGSGSFADPWPRTDRICGTWRSLRKVP